MSDKERIDRAPVLGRVESITGLYADQADGQTIRQMLGRDCTCDDRAEKAETELERLREGVKALADEWEAYGHKLRPLNLGYELTKRADALRGLLDEDGGA